MTAWKFANSHGFGKTGSRLQVSPARAADDRILYMIKVTPKYISRYILLWNLFLSHMIYRTWSRLTSWTARHQDTNFVRTSRTSPVLSTTIKSQFMVKIIRILISILDQASAYSAGSLLERRLVDGSPDYPDPDTVYKTLVDKQSYRLSAVFWITMIVVCRHKSMEVVRILIFSTNLIDHLWAKCLNLPDTWQCSKDSKVCCLPNSCMKSVHLQLITPCCKFNTDTKIWHLLLIILFAASGLMRAIMSSKTSISSNANHLESIWYSLAETMLQTYLEQCQ